MKTAIIAFAVVQVVFYLIFAFVSWDWWWVFQVGDWNKAERAAFLFSWMACSVVSILVTIIIEDAFK